MLLTKSSLSLGSRLSFIPPHHFIILGVCGSKDFLRERDISWMANWTTVDPYTELIEPAVNGTISILNAITHSTAAASVRRVVITSSSAALLSEADFSNPKAVFSESTWNPVTYADINKSKATAYRLSKTMAEKAAWDFVKDPANNAKFDLAVINPPLVFGPVRHHLSSLSAINTSNKPVVDCLTGKWKHGIAPNGQSINYVDVRDIAEAHVRAGLEIPEAGGQRFFPTAGMFCNRDICEIIRTNFPDYAEKLPSPDIPGGEFPPKDQVYSYDNSATSRVLGIKWIHFEQSIVETVKSLKAWGA